MSISYISVELRRIVLQRAGGICEYCLMADIDSFLGCQIDHIVGEKHGGPTAVDNLALACVYCNQAKGSDIGSILWATGEFVRLFNPRLDSWSEHFTLIESRIEPLSSIGQVTANLLNFNAPEQIGRAHV